MQKIINKILQTYLDRFALTYMDDILIDLNIIDDHIKNVNMVVDILRQKIWKLKRKNTNSILKNWHSWDISSFQKASKWKQLKSITSNFTQHSKI